VNEGDQQQKIADLVENAVAQHVGGAFGRELEAVALDEGENDSRQKGRHGGRENGIAGRGGLLPRRRRKPLREHARHAVEHENAGVVNDVGAAAAFFDGEEQRDQNKNKADDRAGGQLLVKQQNTREEGEHHAAQLGEQGVDREIDLFKGLETAIGEHQTVDRPKEGEQQSKPGKFYPEPVDDQKDQQPRHIVAEEKGQKRLGAAAVFLLKPLVEEKLHAEHQHRDHNDTVIHDETSFVL